MTLPDVLKTALKNIAINRRRSILTMLGIIIGIMSVILVRSVGAGAESLITNQLQARGTDMVGVLAGASDPEGPPASVMGIVVTTLTYEDAIALRDPKNVKHVEHVSAYVSGNDTLQWQNVDRSITYTGTTASYEQVEKITLAEGRFFGSEEEDRGDKVVVLGSAIAEEIFGNQSPIGEMMKIKKKTFKVIGILSQKGSDGFENPDNAVLIPLKAAQQELLGIKHVNFIRLKMGKEEYVPQAVEEVTATLKERHDGEDFSVRTVADLLKTLTAITSAIQFFLVAIAGISLFVGGVGIMNIMLIAVKEKTREIGLRKSIGATNGDILKQFLFETVTLSLFGGVIGIMIGGLTAFVIAKVVQSLGYAYTFSLSLSTILVACAIAVFIGMIFGVGPARRAASLHPIDALRYE